MENSSETIWSVSWHPLQSLLASVGSDKSIKLWKQQSDDSWLKVETIETSHLKTVRCVKFSNKGDKIAVCSFDSTISIYILNENCYEYLTELEGHENEVKCVDWHETDLKIASCSRDTNIWVWGFNPTTYEYECENILEGHKNDIKCIKWLDYSTLASASYDDTIRIWMENDDDYEEDQVLKGHEGIVWDLAYDQQQKMLVSVSSDLSAMVWTRNEMTNKGKFKLSYRIAELHSEPIYSVALVWPYLLTGGGDNLIRLGKLEYDEQPEKMAQIVGYKPQSEIEHQSDVNCVRTKLTKDGSYLVASCSDDETIRICQLSTSHPPSVPEGSLK